MKYGRIAIALMLLLASVSISFAAEQKWFHIGRNQEYITDFALTPKEEKEVKIPAADKQFILFRSDTDGVTKETLENGPYPIKMTDLGSRKSIDSFYGGMDLTPRKGEIRVNFKNVGDRTFRVVVLRMNKSTSSPPPNKNPNKE